MNPKHLHPIAEADLALDHGLSGNSAVAQFKSIHKVFVENEKEIRDNPYRCLIQEIMKITALNIYAVLSLLGVESEPKKLRDASIKSFYTPQLAPFSFESIAVAIGMKHREFKKIIDTVKSKTSTGLLSLSSNIFFQKHILGFTQASDGLIESFDKQDLNSSQYLGELGEFQYARIVKNILDGFFEISNGSADLIRAIRDNFPISKFSVGQTCVTIDGKTGFVRYQKVNNWEVAKVSTVALLVHSSDLKPFSLPALLSELDSGNLAQLKNCIPGVKNMGLLLTMIGTDPRYKVLVLMATESKEKFRQLSVRYINNLMPRPFSQL